MRVILTVLAVGCLSSVCRSQEQKTKQLPKSSTVASAVIHHNGTVIHSFQLLDNGTVLGIAEMSNQHYAVDVIDPRWAFEKGVLKISWSLQSSVSTTVGIVSFSGQIKYILNQQKSGNWSGTGQFSGTGPKGESLDSSGNVTALIFKPGEDEDVIESLADKAMTDGAESIQQNKLNDLKNEAAGLKAQAEDAAIKADADKQVVISQQAFAADKKQVAMESAAMVGESNESVAEVINAFEDADSAESKLAKLEDDARKSQKIATEANKASIDSTKAASVAEKIGDRTSKIIGLFGPVGDVIWGDRKVQELNEQGRHEDAYVQMWETGFGVAAQGVTWVGAAAIVIPEPTTTALGFAAVFAVESVFEQGAKIAGRWIGTNTAGFVGAENKTKGFRTKDFQD